MEPVLSSGSPCWALGTRGRGVGSARPPRPAPCPTLCFPVPEIIFVRAITPAHPANHADIIFDITEGNLRDSFDIVKRYMDGMTVGEWPEASLVLPARRAVRVGDPLRTSSAPPESPSQI